MNIWFLMLIFFQLLPVIIILFFVIQFSGDTRNSGWIFDEVTDCKFFTQTNYENRSFEWTGSCVDGLAHGKGKLILLQNGYEYLSFEGFLFKGKMQGFGKSIMLDGDTYEGHYAGGQASGQGRSYNDEGDYYEGHFLNGSKSGKGTHWYEPESEFLKYTGEWKEGRISGEGTLFYRDGRKVSGIFKDEILIKGR